MSLMVRPFSFLCLNLDLLDFGILRIWGRWIGFSTIAISSLSESQIGVDSGRKQIQKAPPIAIFYSLPNLERAENKYEYAPVSTLPRVADIPVAAAMVAANQLF